jgi:hypothetical protein
MFNRFRQVAPLQYRKVVNKQVMRAEDAQTRTGKGRA